MEFLNPAALYAFALLPLLLLPYLIRRRPRRLLFSSLLLLREFAARAPARPWGRLRLPPIFFLQLLLLALLFSALGEPTLALRPASVALVLDNSASMQALEGGKSRFQSAREEAETILRALPARARVDLYLIAPRLAPVAEQSLTPDEAGARLARLKPLDLGEPAIDYGAELERLAGEKKYQRLHFLTDHPATGQSAAVRVVTLGRPQANLALTAFEVAPRSLAAPQLEARAAVKNFSATAQKFTLALKSGGKLIAARAYSVAPGRSVEAAFENIPRQAYYEAELDAGDALALDNRRFAVPPPEPGLKILAVTPRPAVLASLRAIPGVELQIVSPEAYEKGEFGAHALEIFHYAAPAALPESHALFILPPKQNPLVQIGAAAVRPAVTGWREPHPLTRYVNFALFRPAYARALKAGRGEPIVESPDGPLAVALEQNNSRYLALGFDLFPFLGQRNLPVSIFTLNLLEWFHEARGRSGGATGEPLPERLRAGASVLAPDGAKSPAENSPALFTQTYVQGVYRITAGAAEKLFAVNLGAENESDLREPPAIRLRGAPAAADGRAFYASLWPYLLLAALALLLLEWFINPAPAREPAAGEPVKRDDFRWA